MLRGILQATAVVGNETRKLASRHYEQQVQQQIRQSSATLSYRRSCSHRQLSLPLSSSLLCRHWIVRLLCNTRPESPRPTNAHIHSVRHSQMLHHHTHAHVYSFHIFVQYACKHTRTLMQIARIRTAYKITSIHTRTQPGTPLFMKLKYITSITRLPAPSSQHPTFSSRQGFAIYPPTKTQQ